jgi:hypothetical protein
MAGHSKLGNKKAPGCRGLRGFLSLRGLTLGELEALAGAGAAGLLTFAHTAVAGKETFFLQRSAEGGVHLLDRTSETMGDGTSLAVGAAADNADDDVELAVEAGGRDWEGGGLHQGLGVEVFFNGLAVDDDDAGTAGKAERALADSA